MTVPSDVLQRMMDAINTGLTYQAREAEGTQAPSENLAVEVRQPAVTTPGSW